MPRILKAAPLRVPALPAAPLEASTTAAHASPGATIGVDGAKDGRTVEGIGAIGGGRLRPRRLGRTPTDLHRLSPVSGAAAGRTVPTDLINPQW